jgi:uncharacterized membrane protein
MSKLYNRIAGGSIERLSALSDGIFAVAMTLLVLDLRVPVLDVVHAQQPLWVSGAAQSENALWVALLAVAPRLVTYLMSFLTLGIFWLGQQAQLSTFERSDRSLSWFHLVFLLAVVLMPFSTALLAEYITYRLALVVYWLNLLFLGVMLFCSWRYGIAARLAKDEITDAMRSAIERRIVIYQALYALCVSLCIFSTYLSILFLVLLQLHSVISPELKAARRAQ